MLALHHKVLPTTINVEQPNKKFDMDNSPIYINTETRPWLKNGNPRRAGVSAFGFGGINVHIVLEEYLGQTSSKFRLNKQVHSIIIQAPNKEALKEKCLLISSKLTGSNKEEVFDGLVGKTKNLQITTDHPRLGITAFDANGYNELLQIALKGFESTDNYWLHPKGICYSSKSVNLKTDKIVGLFAGQGSQYIGMGKDLTIGFPEMLESFQQNDDLYYQHHNELLSTKIFPNPSFSKIEKDVQKFALNRTEHAQPAIGALSMGQYKILSNAGFKPDFVAGHSYGELTALWAGKAFDDETFLLLSQARGKAMSSRSDHASGTMLAVHSSQAEVEKIISKFLKLL